MPKSWIPLLGNGFKFPSIFHNGMIVNDRTEEFDCRQQEKIQATEKGNATLEFTRLCSQEAHITDVDISHGKKRDHGNNIRCVDHTINWGFKFNIIMTVANTRASKRVAGGDPFTNRRIMLQALRGNRGKRGTQGVTRDV